MEATYMYLNRGMDKEYVVHIYNGILLSHKKKWNWVICRDLNGSKIVIQSEESQREKQIPYIN